MTQDGVGQGRQTAASFGPSREYRGVNEQVIVKNLSVLVHETDEGVVVDIYPLGEEGVDEPLGTTYAFFTEGSEEDTDEAVR